MKIRQTFVSNSSSSSFSLVIDNDLYEKILEELSIPYKITAEFLVSRKKNFAVYSGYQSDDYSHLSCMEEESSEELNKICKRTNIDKEAIFEIFYDLESKLITKANKLDPEKESFVYESWDW